jgi:hypothetical protein
MYRSGRCLRVAATLCALVLAAGTLPLRATVLRYLPFEEQVDSSRVIVVGTVVGRAAKWNGSHTLISTEVVVRVEQALKGSPGATLTVSVPGGVLDGIGQAVDGAPNLLEGRRYVLFLERTDGAAYRVTGFSQGSYAVTAAADGKSRVAPQLAAQSRVQVLGGSAGAGTAGRGLEEFLSRVRARLDTSAVRSAGQ